MGSLHSVWRTTSMLIKHGIMIASVFVTYKGFYMHALSAWFIRILLLSSFASTSSIKGITISTTRLKVYIKLFYSLSGTWLHAHYDYDYTLTVSFFISEGVPSSWITFSLTSSLVSLLSTTSVVTFVFNKGWFSPSLCCSELMLSPICYKRTICALTIG